MDTVYVWYSFVHVVRSRDWVPWTLHIRHSVVSSLVTVCPCRSSVHCFLVPVLSRGVNVTCSRSQRTAPSRGSNQGPLGPNTVHYKADECQTSILGQLHRNRMTYKMAIKMFTILNGYRYNILFPCFSLKWSHLLK